MFWHIVLQESVFKVEKGFYEKNNYMARTVW